MTEAVIFDMDGVLIDSGAHHRAAWRALLAELGEEPAHPEYWRLTIGRPSEEALPLLLGRRVSEHESWRLARRKRDLYVDFARAGMVSVPGVREFVMALARLGIPRAVGTSASRFDVDRMLVGVGLRRHFDVIVTADDVTLGSRILRSTSWPPRGSMPAEACIVFQDSEVGVLARGEPACARSASPPPHTEAELLRLEPRVSSPISRASSGRASQAGQRAGVLGRALRRAARRVGAGRSRPLSPRLAGLRRHLLSRRQSRRSRLRAGPRCEAPRASRLGRHGLRLRPGRGDGSAGSGRTRATRGSSSSGATSSQRLRLRRRLRRGLGVHLLLRHRSDRRAGSARVLHDILKPEASSSAASTLERMAPTVPPSPSPGRTSRRRSSPSSASSRRARPGLTRAPPRTRVVRPCRAPRRLIRPWGRATVRSLRNTIAKGGASMKVFRIAIVLF